MEKFYYTSSCGKMQIAAYALFPETEPKGVIYFAHGVMEYTERHLSFLNMLVQNGYIVLANDHMGHGNSQDIFPMFFSDRIGVNGWSCACNDAYLCVYYGRKKFGISRKLPLFGIGFSLGSFIIRTVAIRNPGFFNGGVILLGTGDQNPIKTNLGKFVANKESKKCGKTNTTPKITELTFKSFNRHFRESTIADWFCLNKKSRNKYVNDDKCGKEITAGLFYDILCGIEYTGNFMNIKQMDKDTPILMLSGSRDPVGDFGKSVRWLYRKFRLAGLNVTCILYNHMRHDILHELDGKKVRQDILDFLEGNLNTKIENIQRLPA